MNVAMTEFNIQLFKNSHQSYYTELDINMLDEYRTLTNAGIENNTKGHNDVIEIDVAKAFTSSLASISEIPIFNELDEWKPYYNEAVKDLNLYTVFQKLIIFF